MCKFEGRSSMKQYIKNKLIKWGFKYCFRCDNETGYVYQLELYRGRKEKSELNLCSSVVLELCQVLKNIYYHVFFDNFFNSPTLIKKLHDNGLYGLNTARSDRINIQPHYLFACIKWYGNKSVMPFGSHLEEITSTSTVQRRLKGS